MPLIASSSKAAVGQNIKTEMAAGKPQKQAVAIALSVGRRSKGKKKRRTVLSGFPTYDAIGG